MKTMLDPVVADAGNGAVAIDLLNTLNERKKVSLGMHGSGRPRKKLEFWESEQSRPEFLRAFEKTSERLRKGRLPSEGLSFVATTGHRLIGTIRLWHVSAGPDRPALLLGPLAVDTQLRNAGLGSALMEQAIRYSRLLGHREIFWSETSPTTLVSAFRRRVPQGCTSQDGSSDAVCLD
jgi:GNAT superfamily N-acetyltransferase